MPPRHSPASTRDTTWRYEWLFVLRWSQQRVGSDLTVNWFWVWQRLYCKYFSTLPSESAQLAVPAPPRWENDETRKRKSESSVGYEVVTEQDRVNKFVRKQKIVVPGAAPSKPSPVSNGKASTPGGFPRRLCTKRQCTFRRIDRNSARRSVVKFGRGWTKWSL